MNKLDKKIEKFLHEKIHFVYLSLVGLIFLSAILFVVIDGKGVFNNYLKGELVTINSTVGGLGLQFENTYSVTNLNNTFDISFVTKGVTGHSIGIFDIEFVGFPNDKFSYSSHSLPFHTLSYWSGMASVSQELAESSNPHMTFATTNSSYVLKNDDQIFKLTLNRPQITQNEVLSFQVKATYANIDNNYSTTQGTITVNLNVINSPTVNAGPDGAVCAGGSYALSGATATNYSSVLWQTTNGNGLFQNSSVVNTVYSVPTSGYVSPDILKITANPMPGAVGGAVSDSLSLTVNPLPTVNVPQIQPVQVGSAYITFPPITGGTYKDAQGNTVTGFNPVAVGTFPFSLTVVSAYGCSNSANFNVVVTPLEIPTIGWANLQWPPSGTITLGDEYIVSAQIWIDGITELEGADENLGAWIGYSTENTNPATWTNWVPADWNESAIVGNNDEYTVNLGVVIPSSGNYYYASRFVYNNSETVYGGYAETGGGFWDGNDNISGLLTVSPTTAYDMTITSAQALAGNSSVNVVMSHDVNLTAISAASMTISGAAINSKTFISGNQFTLGTSALIPSTQYTLSISNLSFNNYATSGTVTKTFVSNPLNPVYELGVLAASSINNTTVDVTFNKNISASSLGSATFTFAGGSGLTATTWSLQTDTKVRVTTSSQSAVNYTVTVGGNIKATNGDMIDPTQDEATFTGKAQSTILFGDCDGNGVRMLNDVLQALYATVTQPEPTSPIRINCNQDPDETKITMNDVLAAYEAVMGIQN